MKELIIAIEVQLISLRAREKLLLEYNPIFGGETTNYIIEGMQDMELAATRGQIEALQKCLSTHQNNEALMYAAEVRVAK